MTKEKQEHVHLILPVYYIKKYSTKPDKTILANLNFARNSHYYLQNEVKQWYNDFILKELHRLKPEKIEGEYEIDMIYYYKNTLSDLDNVCAQQVKYLSYALDKYGLIKKDSVIYCKKIAFYTGTQDKAHPRVECFIRKYEKKDKK